jgi:hypothetical protein
MFTHTLAILIATTVPALAGGKIISVHEVRFEHESFICGKVKAASGKVVRFIHSTPPAKYISEYEPAARYPQAKSWDMIYRVICEGGYQRPNLTSRLGHHKRS